MSEHGFRWHVYANPDDVAEAVVAAIAAEARRAISTAERFVIVLVGGSTPRAIYARVAELDTPWTRWHVYFGDERCLPVGDRQRNDRMARDAWLNHVPIPARQIHTIPAELGPEAGAAIYRRELAGVGTFDLTLLGLGADGHTASLFPGHPWGVEAGAPDALAVHSAPAPPRERVTLSAARLARSGSVYLIVVGKDKREALTRLRDGAQLPVRSVVPPNGMNVYIDHAASPRDCV